MNNSFCERALEHRNRAIGGSRYPLDLLGRLLRMARVACKLEQREVCLAVSLTTDTLSKVERGLVLPNPGTVKSLVLYYEGLGVRFFPVELAVSLPRDMRPS